MKSEMRVAVVVLAAGVQQAGRFLEPLILFRTSVFGLPGLGQIFDHRPAFFGAKQFAQCFSLERRILGRQVQQDALGLIDGRRRSGLPG